MSIRENVSATIEPEDRHRVKAVAAAILEAQGFEANILLDLVIDDAAQGFPHRHTARAGAAVELAACIVNYLREELEPEIEQAKADSDLLQALQREASQ